MAWLSQRRFSSGAFRPLAAFLRLFFLLLPCQTADALPSGQLPPSPMMGFGQWPAGNPQQRRQHQGMYQMPDAAKPHSQAVGVGGFGHRPETVARASNGAGSQISGAGYIPGMTPHGGAHYAPKQRYGHFQSVSSLPPTSGAGGGSPNRFDDGSGRLFPQQQGQQNVAGVPARSPQQRVSKHQQFFEEFDKLMERGSYLDAREPLVAAAQLLGGGQEVWTRAARLRFSLGLADAPPDEVDAWLGWRRNGRTTFHKQGADRSPPQSSGFSDFLALLFRCLLTGLAFLSLVPMGIFVWRRATRNKQRDPQASSIAAASHNEAEQKDVSSVVSAQLCKEVPPVIESETRVEKQAQVASNGAAPEITGEGTAPECVGKEASNKAELDASAIANKFLDDVRSDVCSLAAEDTTLAEQVDLDQVEQPECSDSGLPCDRLSTMAEYDGGHIVSNNSLWHTQSLTECSGSGASDSWEEVQSQSRVEATPDWWSMARNGRQFGFGFGQQVGTPCGNGNVQLGVAVNNDGGLPVSLHEHLVQVNGRTVSLYSLCQELGVNSAASSNGAVGEDFVQQEPTSSQTHSSQSQSTGGDGFHRTLSNGAEGSSLRSKSETGYSEDWGYQDDGVENRLRPVSMENVDEHQEHGGYDVSRSYDAQGYPHIATNAYAKEHGGYDVSRSHDAQGYPHIATGQAKKDVVHNLNVTTQIGNKVTYDDDARNNFTRDPVDEKHLDFYEEESDVNTSRQRFEWNGNQRIERAALEQELAEEPAIKPLQALSANLVDSPWTSEASDDDSWRVSAEHTQEKSGKRFSPIKPKALHVMEVNEQKLEKITAQQPLQQSQFDYEGQGDFNDQVIEDWGWGCTAGPGSDPAAKAKAEEEARIAAEALGAAWTPQAAWSHASQLFEARTTAAVSAAHASAARPVSEAIAEPPKRPMSHGEKHNAAEKPQASRNLSTRKHQPANEGNQRDQQQEVIEVQAKPLDAGARARRLQSADGKIYFAGGPGNLDEANRRSKSKGNQRNADSGGGNKQDTFVRATAFRFRADGCQVRLRDGSEAWLGVEHMVPRTNASTVAVRNQVKELSANVGMRVRVLEAGKVTLIVPEDMESCLQDVEAMRREIDEGVAHLRETYDSKKWLSGHVSAVQSNGIYVHVVDGKDAFVPTAEIPATERVEAEEDNGDKDDDENETKDGKEGQPKAANKSGLRFKVGQVVQFRVVRYSWQQDSFSASLLSYDESVAKRRSSRSYNQDTGPLSAPPAAEPVAYGRQAQGTRREDSDAKLSKTSKFWTSRGYDIVDDSAAKELNEWLRASTEDKKNAQTKSSKAAPRSTDKTYIVNIVRGMLSKSCGQITLPSRASDQELKQAAVDAVIREGELKQGQQHKGITVAKNIITVKG